MRLLKRSLLTETRTINFSWISVVFVRSKGISREPWKRWSNTSRWKRKTDRIWSGPRSASLHYNKRSLRHSRNRLLLLVRCGVLTFWPQVWEQDHITDGLLVCE